MSRQPSFASRLRWWRRHRAISQLDLAGRTQISQRHLSFMELGRASPSRDMVMRLAAALDVPLTIVMERPDGVEYRRAVVADQGLGGRNLDVTIAPTANALKPSSTR